jgi:hypothetical protein
MKKILPFHWADTIFGAGMAFLYYEYKNAYG